nr:hypothetical protein [Salinigranum rubrum]
MPVDTVITGGTLVTAQDTFEGAIAFDDGKIVAVGDEASMPDARETVDASGLLVMPGMIDPHVHIEDHFSIDTYETGTAAAALGESRRTSTSRGNTGSATSRTTTRTAR